MPESEAGEFRGVGSSLFISDFRENEIYIILRRR